MRCVEHHLIIDRSCLDLESGYSLKGVAFFWKVTWDLLPMHSLLRDRGMGLPHFAEYADWRMSIEYTLLCCLRMRLVWRMVGNQSWVASTSPWMDPFLDAFGTVRLR